MAIARLIGLILLTLFTFAVGSGTNTAAAIATAIFFPAAGALYFLPSIEARINEQPNVMSIFLLNLFLGWTLVGWVITISWAHKKPSIAMLHTPVNTDERACQFCAEPIRKAAIKCRHCGSELAQTSATNR